MKNTLNKEEFYKYLFSESKIKINKINDLLVEDIKENNKENFLEKWNIFLLKEFKLSELNFSKIWFNLINYNHIDWLKDINLPFNKFSYCILYACKKYYLESKQENSLKNREVLNYLFNQMKKTNKYNLIIKDIESLKNYIKMSIYEKNEEACKHYLNVILEIDELYRSLKPQNPDKFLTQIILTQGKEIENSNYINNYKQPLSNHYFFNVVTIKLIERLIKFNGMGVNQLNNKKNSQSLNDIYYFFQKYYMYHKFNDVLNSIPEKQKTKKIKI
jgi:hypothetical protein